LFIQGGVDFTPYLPVFEKILGAKKPPFLELFPASEGFFAFQNSLTDNGMLLLLDRGIFYEFIPLEEYGKPNAPRLTLQEVEMDKQYAMIISTNAGLWAYDLGDTVKFTSLAPYKIRVSGRVKHFLSAFGEHVITEEVNQALLRACEQTGAGFQEFTVAPFVSPLKGASYHEWFVEFTQLPQNWDNFIEVLDAALQAKNPYYKDLREGNLLKPPKINILALHATRDYMKSVGKLGGQNKFPRLTNNRKIADALQSWVKN
jgi:hypothetical protein